jgi:1-acyl-sn-glycerol-3-phosphate acyltransferase
MHRLASWAGTVAFLPVLGAVLLVFDVAQRAARLAGQRPQEHVATWLQMAIVAALRLCDIRLVVERPPGFRGDGRYVIVSNHQSMLDIPILGTLFRRAFPKYIAKRSLGRGIPSVSYNLRRGGHLLIDRADGAGAVAAIRGLGERVRRGEASAVIFPEGTRSRHGALGEFRRAGTLALLEAAPEAPVVPVTVDESWKLLRHNMFPLPWGVRVRVRIGEPIARRSGEDRAALLDRVRGVMEETLARWRPRAPSPAQSPPLPSQSPPPGSHAGPASHSA